MKNEERKMKNSIPFPRRQMEFFANSSFFIHNSSLNKL